MGRLMRDVYAASSQASMASKSNTVEELLAKWDLRPYPPTAETMLALAATLKEGGYVSAASYLSTYKVMSVRRGCAWNETLVRILQD